MRSSGEWVDAFIPEGHVAVLAGHTLERATCGLIKAAKHRVVCLQQLIYSSVHSTYSALQQSASLYGAFASAQATSHTRLPR